MYVLHFPITILTRSPCSTPRQEDALLALRDIVLRYPVSPVYLTALHPIFIRACVATRNFEIARPVLENFITEVDPRAFPVTYLDNLIYHYGGGVAFAVLRQWEEAQDFFEIVIGAPVSGNPSAIQLEAAKKLALVHLLRHGQLVNLPKYVHPMLNKLVRNSPYGALAKAYPSGAYITVMEKEEKVFKGDNNWGLVNLVVEKAPRWKLKTLNKTYQTLSLSEIAKEIGMPNDGSLRGLVETMVRLFLSSHPSSGQERMADVRCRSRRGKSLRHYRRITL
jgi:COP9 signalosome complex subunit 3